MALLPKAKSQKPKAYSLLSRFERRELTWLLVGLGGCILLFVFLALAGEVMEGETAAFDKKIVLGFRKADNPSLPIGPAWITSVLLDLTSLGGPTVITLVVLAVVGFLLLQTRYWTALFILVTAATGDLVNYAMKSVFARPRPSVVPHLREAFSSSFPSGHAMQSAIIYLTLGAMLMRVADRRSTKVYCLAIAVLLTTLVGISRVYLGVHYPTDVVAGWIVGFLWAAACWLVAKRFERSTGIEAEKAKVA